LLRVGGQSSRNAAVAAGSLAGASVCVGKGGLESQSLTHSLSLCGG
jgi:hypothetical protein